MTTMQERYVGLIQANGPLCTECDQPWVEPSPDCPHQINDVHPLTPLPDDYLAEVQRLVTFKRVLGGPQLGEPAPSAELALISDSELAELVGTRTVPIREWASSLVSNDDFPEDDPDEVALGILAGILLAKSSEEALAVTNLQRAKELCGNVPGGHSPLLEITAAMPFKSTYEQGAPCYAMVSATVVSTGEKFKFTTGAKAVQAVLIAHLAHGWMPFRCLITMRSTPTQRGFYPINLEAGG